MGISMDTLTEGYDVQGVFLLIMIIILMIFKVSYFIKKN